MSPHERLERLRQKLAQLDAHDTQRVIFGAPAHQYYLQPVLSLSEVERFEAHHRLTLSLEYKLFLTELGNGGAGPYHGLYSLATGESEAQNLASPQNWAQPFPYDSETTRAFIRHYQTYWEDGDDEDIVYPEAPEPLTGILFLAEYGSGWSYGVVAVGEQAGTIWFHGDYLAPAFNFETGQQWSFFDWYEDWLDRSLAELLPAPEKRKLGLQNTILNYDGWKLSAIPAEVFANSGLKKLVFSRNELTEFPPALTQLTQLRTLDLSMTPLVDIPETIAQLTQLRKLRLNYNHHTRLPAALARLEQLEELSLCYNPQLTTLPKVVGHLAHLKTLKVAYCQTLTTIPTQIGNLTQLELLCLNDSPLTALPESLGQLTRLKRLQLGNTQLTRLPQSVAQLINLEFLDIAISALDLEQAIPILSTLPKLHTLALVNQLDFPSTLANLKTVRRCLIHPNYALWHQGYKQMPLPDNLTLLPNLEELDLTNNNQTARLPESLDRLRHLKRLRLYSTAIRDVPDSLRWAPLEHIEAHLSQDPNHSWGLLPHVKEKIQQWFPQAQVWIW